MKMKKIYSLKFNLFDHNSFTFFTWLILILLFLNHFIVVIFRIIRIAYLFHQIFYSIHIIIFIFFHPYFLFINFRYLSDSFITHFHFSINSDFIVAILYFYPFILFFHTINWTNYVFNLNIICFIFPIFVLNLEFIFYKASNYHLTILAFHPPRPQSLWLLIWEFIIIDWFIFKFPF